MDRDAREPVAVANEGLEPAGAESERDSGSECERERSGRPDGPETGERRNGGTLRVVCAGGRFRSGAHETFDAEHLFRKNCQSVSERSEIQNIRPFGAGHEEL